MNRPGCFLNSCKCSASTASCSEEFHCFIMPEPLPWACFEACFTAPLHFCPGRDDHLKPIFSQLWEQKKWHLTCCPIWGPNSIELNYLIRSKHNSAQQIEIYSSFCRATRFVTRRCTDLFQLSICRLLFSIKTCYIIVSGERDTVEHHALLRGRKRFMAVRAPRLLVIQALSFWALSSSSVSSWRVT